jgi:hypothetical protein
MTEFELSNGSARTDGKRLLRILDHPDGGGHAHALTVPELADLRRLLAAEVDENTGRKMITRAYGNSVAELEANAITEGRLLFGPDTPLAADPKWTAVLVSYADRHVHPDLDPEARFAADITVRELTQGASRWAAQFTP